jgi:hypothetical protein
MLASLFLAGGAASTGFDLKVRRSTPATDAYRPTYRHLPGPRLALVFIGSASCAASNDPRLAVALRTLQQQTKEYAASVGANFISVGATTDWRAARAYEFLSNVGHFDQLVLGGSWANPAVITTVWQAGNAPAVPAIAVLFQDVTTPESPEAAFNVTNGEVLFFVSGLDAILHHQRRGMANVLREKVTSAGHTSGFPHRARKEI